MNSESAARHVVLVHGGFVAGFAPDQGESVNMLIAGFPADGPQPPTG